MALVSTISIVPAATKTAEHTVALSASGEEPATHYGNHGWIEPREPVPGEVLVEFEGGEPAANFAAVLSEQGLQIVVSYEL